MYRKKTTEEDLKYFAFELKDFVLLAKLLTALDAGCLLRQGFVRSATIDKVHECYGKWLDAFEVYTIHPSCANYQHYCHQSLDFWQAVFCARNLLRGYGFRCNPRVLQYIQDILELVSSENAGKYRLRLPSDIGVDE